MHKNTSNIMDWEEKFLKLHNYLKSNKYIKDKHIADTIFSITEDEIEKGIC